MRAPLSRTNFRALNPDFGPNRGLLQRFVSLRSLIGGKVWHNLAGAGSYLTLVDMASSEGWFGLQTPGGLPSLRLQDTGSPWSQLTYTGAAATRVAYSMAAWVRLITHPSGNSRNDVVFKCGGVPAFQFVGDASGGVKMRCFTPTTNTSSTILPIGSWYRIVWTGDGTNVRFYVNGVLTDTLPNTTAISQFTTVGQYTGAQANALFGDLDDLCYWDRALSAAAVWADYEDSRTGYRRAFVTDPASTAIVANASTSVRGPRPWFGAQTRSL